MKPLNPVSAGLLRLLAATSSRRGSHASLLILTFHRVLRKPDPLLPGEPDAAEFAAQMDLVGRLCNVVSMSEAMDGLRSGSLPRRAICITFDDGYSNNIEVAAPILAARNLPATFFVATGYVGGQQMFNDIVIEAVRVAPPVLDLSDLDLGKHALPDIESRRAIIDAILGQLKYRDPTVRLRLAEEIAARVGLTSFDRTMMTQDGLRRLLALGMEIGAHTVTHPILARISREQAWEEIAGSKRYLETVLGTPVRWFAYPNGRPVTDYLPEHTELVRAAGFEAAVSTAWGAAERSTDRFQLPRVGISDRRPFVYGLRLVRAYAQRSRPAV